MDILTEEYSPDGPQPELNELIETQPTPVIPVPQRATRNRAAQAAILTSPPDKLVEKYRLMMAEGAEGKEFTHKAAMDEIDAQAQSGNMKHVIAILGDTSIPLEQKKRLMNFVQTGGLKEDPSRVLQTQALVGDSKGEDLRGEGARISMSDVMGEMQREREDRQKLMNGMIAQFPEASVKTVSELAESEVMPFGRNYIGANVAESVRKKMGVPTSLGQWVKDFLLPGSTRADLQKKLMSIPPQDRDVYTKSLLGGIKDSSSVFHNENYFSQFTNAVELLDSPQHSNTGIWTSNMMTVLDALWVGGEVKALKAAVTGSKSAAAFSEATSKARRPGSAAPGVSDAEYVEKATWELVDPPFNPNQIPSGTKRLTGPSKVVDDVKRLEVNAAVHRPNTAAPYSIVEQANPAKAREMHEAIIASPDDELAEALTGVSREQALANNTFPQAGTASGNVLSKVNQDVQAALTNTGATRYTASEFDQAVANVQRDFRNASNLEINDAMTTFRVDGDHMIIDAHYGTVGGSFVTPDAAMAQAQYALRHYGIRPEEIQVMKRVGVDYVPAEGATAAGDYMIKVNTKLPINDAMVDSWQPLDVKRNWTDRIAQTGSENRGAVSGWLMDPGSMLHPTISGSASIASDQAITMENILLKPIKELRTEIASYPSARVKAIEEYLVEANTKGLKHDPFLLANRGFSPQEINSLAKWKDIWDGHYYLENYDLVRTLNSQGFQLFENANTRLFGKPVAKNQNIGSVYDPQTDSIVNLSKVDMDSLYNQGGSYVSLRRPVKINGVDVEHMMVRNTPTEYMRGIRDTDSVLNYREGYYTINYKAAKFIDEITISGGKEVRRTVAVAGNTADADMFVASQQQATGVRHEIREDSRGFKKDGDGYWDVNEAAGRIAQRMRGKPLTEAQGMNTLGAGSFIENPMESAVRAAKSLAGRSISRPVLETAKQRFLSQYGDMLPSDNMGGKKWPSSRNEIVDHGSHTSSRVADARTTYGHINFLEDGYINSADEIFKGGMNTIADFLGEKHLSMAERAARKIGDIAPSHAAKGVVFHAYIAMSNPIRQWIVQSHQAGRMVAYNPVGMMNGGWAKRMAGYLQVSGDIGSPSADAIAFAKFVNDSGMVAGVDRNSLVRGLGLAMADSSSKWKRGVGMLTSLPQTIGFDIGEKVNQLGHLASVHERWTRQGANLADKTTRDLALTEARALSYDLNKAGELTYTQSTPAMILQFLQMPHKAMLQALNRKLPLLDRIKLQAWDLIMWGPPVGLITQMMTMGGADEPELLPENPELREMVTDGMEAYYLNQLFTRMDDSGEKTRLDLSALAPNAMDGWAKMFSAMLSDGVLGTLAASPAGQLVAANGVNGSRRNGRIVQSILTTSRFFNIVDEIDPMEPTEFKQVLNDVAKITSGWTAADNALIMLESRKKTDAMGVVVDAYMTTPEIYGAFLGFGTKSTKDLYEITKSLSESKKKHEERTMAKYRDIMAYYKEKLAGDNPDIKHIQRVSSMLMQTFPDPADRALVTKQWQKDMVGKEQQLLKSMIEASGMPQEGAIMDKIKMAPIPEDQKAQVMQRFKDMKQMREKLKAGE